MRTRKRLWLACVSVLCVPLFGCSLGSVTLGGSSGGRSVPLGSSDFMGGAASTSLSPSMPNADLFAGLPTSSSTFAANSLPPGFPPIPAQ